VLRRGDGLGDAGDDEEEVGLCRKSAHDFLTVAGTSVTSLRGAGEDVEVWSDATLEEVTKEEDSTSSANSCRRNSRDYDWNS
jgi:hypothetical protein